MERYSFTARQVVDITGVAYPSLADLVRRDIIVPSKHRGTGRGDNHVFSVADVFGVAAIQFLRPKTETNDLLRAVFRFWHSAAGKRIVEGGKKVGEVIVLDDRGGVSLERDARIGELAASRDAAMLHVIEPNLFMQKLYAELALHRMAGDHAEPNPSGREPRLREPTTETKAKPRGSAPKAKGVGGEGESAPRRKTRERRKA